MPNQNPLISFIVINWKGENYLERCLASIVEQTYHPIEIIVVNNDVYEDIAEEVREKFPDVLFHQSPDNKGYAGGANEGCRLANGDYIVISNNDIYYDKLWAKNIMIHAQKENSPEIFASKLLYLSDKNLINSVGQLFYKDLWAMNEGLEEPNDGRFDEVREAFGPCGAAAFYHKSVIESVGKFDENYFMYLEDVEYHWRARLLGYSCLYVPNSIAYHEHAAGMGRYNLNKLYYSERNRIWMAITILPFPMLIASLFWTIWRYLLVGSLLIRKSPENSGKKKEKFSKIPKTSLISKMIFAWKDALVKLPEYWKKRRQIQAKRVISHKEIKRLIDKFELDSEKVVFR